MNTMLREYVTERADKHPFQSPFLRVGSDLGHWPVDGQVVHAGGATWRVRHTSFRAAGVLEVIVRALDPGRRP